MSTEPESRANLVALRDARERAIAQLSDAFAHDLIGVDEFERRLTLAHRSNSVSEVAEIVSDLSAAGPSVALVPVPARPVARASEIDHDSISAILAGVERHGPWTPPRHLRAFAVFGGMVLDFREALLPPGVTEIRVVAIMGGAQVIVPPGLSVEISGTAIMGGFAHVERTPTQPDPARTVLRVRGLALMGGVAVETRLVGESEHDAHRRRKRQRRELRSTAEAKRLPQGTGRSR